MVLLHDFTAVLQRKKKLNIAHFAHVRLHGTDKKRTFALANFCKQQLFNFSNTMNQYETVFILTPVLSDEQMKETVAKCKKILTDNGA